MGPVSAASLTCEVEELDDKTVLRVGGELDLSSAPTLTAQIEATFHSPGTHLLVDLASLGVCGSPGLRALIGAVQEARVHAVDLGIIPPSSPAAMRVIEIS